MLEKTFVLALILSLGLCHDAKIDVFETKEATGEENEYVTVHLKKPDGSEDIELQAQLRFHLINGQVHLNGKPLEHGIVTALRMRINIIEVVKGIRQPQRMVPVFLRVLVLEETEINGKKLLVVEEEFIAVDGQEVLQVDVQKVIWESLIRKPVVTVSLPKSTVHARSRTSDYHVLYADSKFHPRLPDHGLANDDDHYQCHKYDHHHENRMHPHGFQKVKCWYHRLSWKSKIALFSVGFLSVITFVVFCSLCIKKRQNRTMEVSAPINDTVVVDVDDKKPVEKTEDGNYKFHFEFDNEVVVDDNKPLIEE